MFTSSLSILIGLATFLANAGKAIEITSEQAAFIEKLNPCFKERHVEKVLQLVYYKTSRSSGMSSNRASPRSPLNLTE